MEDNKGLRNLGNLFLFAAFFVVGLVYIVSTKSTATFQQEIFTIIIGPILCIVGYAIFSMLIAKSLSGSEQTGDNCYYLGFLFTLSSLSSSLINLYSVENDPNFGGLLEDFGVAVSSTIAGIAVRVILHQLRTEPAQTNPTQSKEEEALSELTESVKQVCDELRESAKIMASHHEQNRKYADTIKRVTDELSNIPSLEQLIDKKLKPLLDDLSKVTTNFASSNSELVDVSSRQEKLLTSIDANSQELKDLIVSLSKNLENMEKVEAESNEKLDSMNSNISNVLEFLKSTKFNVKFFSFRGLRNFFGLDSPQNVEKRDM